MTRIFTLLLFSLLSSATFSQLSVTVQSDTFCAGESVWFKATGMTLYAWSDSINLDTNIGDSVNFSTTTAGVYSITALGYSIFPLDTDTTSFTVVVLENPSTNISSSAGGAICAGASTELVVDGGYVSYVWTPSASLDNDSTDTVLATPTTLTTYRVTVTAANGCSSEDSIEVDVTSGPTVTLTSTADATGGAICVGQTVTITANGAGIATYEWSPTATLNDSTAMTVIATPTTNTTYTVVVTDSNGCTSSASLALIVNSVLPTLTVNLADDTICFGKSTSITLQTNATTFNWTPAATVDNPTSKDVIVSPTATTTYQVIVTRLGCTRTASITVAVLPAPAISATQSSGGSTICLDETDEITVTCPNCIEYVWKFPNSSLTTSNNVQVVSPNISGAVQITITGFDENGCSAAEQVIVNVDSCYVGTPFSVEEIISPNVDVLTREAQIEFLAQSPIEKFSLYNLLGEEVFTTATNSNSLVVSKGDLASGIYVARMLVNGQDVVKKIYIR